MILSGLSFTICWIEKSQLRASYALVLRQGLQEDLPQCPELGVTPFWLVGRHPVPALGPCLSGVVQVSAKSSIQTLYRSTGLLVQLSSVLVPSDLQLSVFNSRSPLPRQALLHLPAQGLVPLCRQEPRAYVGLTHSNIFLVSQVYNGRVKLIAITPS